MEYVQGVNVKSGTVLFVPANEAVQKVQERLGVHVDRMKKLPAWKDFISYITFSDSNLFAEKSGEYENESGLKILVDFVEGVIVEGDTTFQIGKIQDYHGTKVVGIWGILITSELRQRFVAEFWETLPRDVLVLVASQAQPRDIGRLCSSSKTLVSKCDENFYKQMLKVHYNRESDTPKKTFISLSRAKVWTCGDMFNATLSERRNATIMTPELVKSLDNIISFSASNVHSLFLDRDGHAWSAGLGAFGKLGLGEEASGRFPPTRIETLENIVAVSAGSTHSLFLDRDGSVWSCGDGDKGRTGHGDEENLWIPTRIETLDNIITISASSTHSLFLDRDGSVWSCGNGDAGVLGHGDEEPRLIPTRIETLQNIVAISAGSLNSLFLDRDGRVWSCGVLSPYQGNWRERLSNFLPSRIETLQNIVAISAGSNHSLFLDRDGNVFSVGNGKEGQLGLGDRNSQGTPTRVETLQNITAISAGVRYSLFLDRDGSVWSCGEGKYGQLGLDDQSDKLLPTRIKTLKNVIAISTGMKHSLFLA